MDPQQNRLPQSDVRHHSRLEEVLEARIQNLATTLRPRTADVYRYIVGGFLSYVRLPSHSYVRPPNGAAIHTCWVGFATSANKLRP